MGAKAPTGERLAALETQVEALNERSERMDRNIQEMRDVLLKAKGVRLVLAGAIAMTMVVSAAVTSTIGAWRFSTGQ